MYKLGANTFRTPSNKKQKLSSDNTKECITQAANTSNKTLRKQLLIKSGYSKSRFYKLIDIYQKSGDSIFIHKGVNNTNAKTYGLNCEKQIIEMYQKDYQDYSFLEFWKHLVEISGFEWVKLGYLYSIFNKNKIFSPLAKKKTIKKHKLASRSEK